MDIIQDWAAQFFSSHEDLQTYSPYARHFYSLLSTARSYLNPLITQITSKPDLATLALLLLIILLSLKLLDMLYQTLMFWFRLARRMLFWGSLVALGLWIYSRGPDGVAEDVRYWWGVWEAEYGYWREMEQKALSARMGKGKGGIQDQVHLYGGRGF